MTWITAHAILLGVIVVTLTVVMVIILIRDGD